MAATAQILHIAPAGGSAGDSPVPCAETCSDLRQNAQALAAASMPAERRFRSLEELYPRACDLLAAERSLYTGKPLPLADDERRAWEEQVALWQALYIGYALCTDVGGDASGIAAVWQRALDCLGRAMREHARACRAVPASLWRELNNCYRAAEACGLDSVPAGGPGTFDTCKATYLATVLHETANLYALSAAQMQVVETWLPGWVKLLDLRTTPAADTKTPLVVDLKGESGAYVLRTRPDGESLRYIDATALAARLRELATCLRENTPAPELADAMRELPRATLERLLTHLYVQWCSAGTGRIEERRDGATRAQVAVTMHAVHFQISGRAFRQPGLRYTREEEHDLATFGHITERTEQRLLTGRSSALEPWEIVNQGLSGSLGMRRKPDLHSRIGHGQLVAVRTSSTSDPLLAVVQRLKMESDGSLGIGIRVLRGEARGVAVRAAGDPTQKYERAVLLSDEDGKMPPTLVLSRGQFSSGALVEVHANRGEVVRLGEVIERGFDFERLSFSRV